jgi:pyrroloquinoline quinone biosynthesis protein D
MTMANVDYCPRRKRDVIAQLGANATLLLNMGDGSYYSLNEVGGRIWELCDGTRTVAQLVSTLAAAYDVAMQTLELDVVELLEGLRTKNLIGD